jgi:hypothetical protein
MAREFVIRLTGLPQDASDPTWKCEAAGSTACGGWPSQSGYFLQDMRQAAMAFPKTIQTTTLKLGVGWGPWETLARESAGTGGGSSAMGRDGHSWNVSFSPPTEQEGSAIVIVAHSVKEWEVRLVAVDKVGREHFSTGQTSGGGAFEQLNGKFNQLPLSEVKEFRLLARPYHWVEFRNVSLEPGLRTQVEIVDARYK